MKINELIEERLNAKYPHKTIKMLMEVDATSFKPFCRLSVDGRQTSFGFIYDSFLQSIAVGGLTFESFADQFVANVEKGGVLGHTL